MSAIVIPSRYPLLSDDCKLLDSIVDEWMDSFDSDRSKRVAYGDVFGHYFDRLRDVSPPAFHGIRVFALLHYIADIRQKVSGSGIVNPFDRAHLAAIADWTSSPQVREKVAGYESVLQKSLREFQKQAMVSVFGGAHVSESTAGWHPETIKLRDLVRTFRYDATIECSHAYYAVAHHLFKSASDSVHSLRKSFVGSLFVLERDELEQYISQCFKETRQKRVGKSWETVQKGF